jgi:hypothetical protein
MMQNVAVSGLQNRRQFLTGLGAMMGTGALAGISASADLYSQAEKNSAGIPLRSLGRTGQKITILGLGSAPIGHSMPGAAKGVPVYRAALEAGINLVDTAHAYDDAEAYLGELVPAWRDRIFLTTKAAPRSTEPREAYRQVQQQLERSLRLLRTEHVEWAKRCQAMTAEECAPLLAEGKRLAEAWGPRFGPV